MTDVSSERFEARDAGGRLYEEKLDFIKQKSREHRPHVDEKIMWSLHAVRKLRSEGVKKSQVEQGLKQCCIIEDYPMAGRPLPGCLVLSYIDRRPMHIVVAIDESFDRIFIITVYGPTEARWESDWTTRKKQD